MNNKVKTNDHYHVTNPPTETRASLAGRDGSKKMKNKTLKVLTSSNDATWATPQEWYNYLNLEFKFTLDPCCSFDTAKCKKFYTVEDDGLSKSWENERVFMNPPYGRGIGEWMEKAYEESKNGALVVCLIPARVDTLWWHATSVKAADIRFPIGRLKFGDAKHCAPFPVAIVIFRPSYK